MSTVKQAIKQWRKYWKIQSTIKQRHWGPLGAPMMPTSVKPVPVVKASLQRYWGPLGAPMMPTNVKPAPVVKASLGGTFKVKKFKE